MIGRRRFLELISALAVSLRLKLTANSACPLGSQAAQGASGKPMFPVTVPLSPLPDCTGWNPGGSPPAMGDLHITVDEMIAHGFTGLVFPFHLSPADTCDVMNYAQSRGMFITFDRTEGGGNPRGEVQMFGRDAPPAISVYSPRYAPAVREKVVAALTEVKGVPGLYNMFCFQDEPFHMGPEAFGYTEEVRQEFKRRFGYELPPDVQSARKDPKVWLDVINFRSDEFPAGWRQAYRIIKEINPHVKVVTTHDSHNTFGAGVRSNSKLAVDDVFHWGADFADTFVFDMYPYLMYDFRYGECGKLPKPRLSQMHYAFGQIRNLAYTYGKDCGYWFGTFNWEWFHDFMGPELKAQYWAEREMTLTAVAQGANFLIGGYKIPEDCRHWESLGEGLRTIQKAGPGLLECPKVKATAAFLFPRTQYIQLQEEYWNVGLAYELFLRAFGELDVLHEEQVKDEHLAGYQVLVLFDVRLLPDEVAHRIGSFVQGGGIVIADCVANLDAYKNSSVIMPDLFGVRDAMKQRIMRSGHWVPTLKNPDWFIPPDSPDDESAVIRRTVRGTAFGLDLDFSVVSPRPCVPTDGQVVLKMVSGEPALVRRRVGKGQVFLLGFCVQDSYFQTWKDNDEKSREQLRLLLHSLTEETGRRAHVYSSNPDIEAALRTNGKEGYVFVINHEAGKPETQVRLADLGFRVGRIIDVADEHAIEFQETGGIITFAVAAPQDTPRLLRLLPGSAEE
jgi:hypothetical protein